MEKTKKVGGQAVLGRQALQSTPWLTERHGYDPTFIVCVILHLVSVFYKITHNK